MLYLSLKHDGAGWVLLNQRKRIEVDHCGRDSQERGVEAVQHSSVAGQDVAAVLDAEGALEEALHEVAPGAEDHHHQSEPYP